MRNLRCIVVDDEPLAVKMLEGFVARTPFLELAGSFNDPVLALSEIRAQAPDLVFLDIQMPDLDGMELSRMLPQHISLCLCCVRSSGGGCALLAWSRREPLSPLVREN